MCVWRCVCVCVHERVALSFASEPWGAEDPRPPCELQASNPATGIGNCSKGAGPTVDKVGVSLSVRVGDEEPVAHLER